MSAAPPSLLVILSCLSLTRFPSPMQVILDLLPTLAALYFAQRFPADIKLSGVQSSILLALGLQRKSVEDVEAELQLPVAQSLALFVKTIRKMTRSLADVREHEVEKDLPDTKHREGAERVLKSLPAVKQASAASEKRMEDELNEEGREVVRQLQQQQREVIDSLDLKQ